MAAADDLARVFLADAENIADGFIGAFNLRFEEEVGNLASPMHRWLDFVLRYVEPAKRKVDFSTGFWARVPQDVKTNVDRVVRLQCRNGDINPYQSKGLLNNDVSGERRGQRTDLLWADWGIHHFHLTEDDIAPGEYFSERSEWLLFAKVLQDAVFCIDVRHHPKGAGFADDELLAIAVRNWPQIFEDWKAKGVLGLARTEPYSKEDIHALRNGGVSTLYEIDGAVYVPPGVGVTSASTPTRVTLAANDIRRNVNALAAFFANRDGDPSTLCRGGGVERPDWRLCLTTKGLAVYEKSLDIAWPMAGGGPLPNWAETLAPGWAVARFVAAKS